MRNLIKLAYATRSICKNPDCNYPVLNDSVPIGTVYEVDINTAQKGGMQCGGCGVHTPCRFAVARREGGQPGQLPLEIFDEQPLSPQEVALL